MRLFQTSECDDRVEFTPQQQRIADVLHDWDPIGVFDEAVGSDDPTEYDDLVGPLSVVLGQHVTASELIAELDEAMTKDYRMPDLDLTDVAETLIRVWASASEDSPTA